MIKIGSVSKLFFLAGIITILLACNKSTKGVFKEEASQNQLVDSSKKEIKKKGQEMEIAILIKELNYWAEAGGDVNHPIEGVKSTGESISGFEKTMEKLKKNNSKVKWIDGKYILDSSNKN